MRMLKEICMGFLLMALMTMILAIMNKASAQTFRYDTTSTYLVTTTNQIRYDTVKVIALMTTPEIKQANEVVIYSVYRYPFGNSIYLTSDKKPLPKGFIVWMSMPYINSERPVKESPRYIPTVNQQMK